MADIPVSAGALDLPGPTDPQLPGGQASSGILPDLLPSFSDPGCFPTSDSRAGPSPGDFAAGSTGPNHTAAPDSARSGTFADSVLNPLPRLTISPGDSHRLLSGLLDTATRKMDRLNVDNAQREVRRAFDLYQANRRAMFINFNSRR
jgi:hypothetical protein